MSTRSDYIAYNNTTQIHRVAALLSLILLGVGMGVGFSVAMSSARRDADNDYDRRLSIFNKWQMDLTSHFTKAGSLAAIAGAFVLSADLSPANLSAPAAQRMNTTINPDGFIRMCDQYFIPGISRIALAPGGVISQLYPTGFSTPGLDLYNSDTHRVTFRTLVKSTATLTGGPTKLTTRPGYGVFFYSPVHVSNVIDISTFWGISYILLEIPVLTAALNISAIMATQNMNYAMWFTTQVNGSSTAPTVLDESDSTFTQQIISEGMSMRLPISETGRSSFLAMYPKGGPVSPNIKGYIAAIIVVVTIVGVAVVILLVYACAYALFLYRHRLAPTNNSTMYVAALALRGAQPIADKAPLVAVRMFNDFATAVRQQALANNCYPICEVGDRCVYVAAKDPADLMSLAQYAVLNISIQGNIPVTSTVLPSIRSFHHRPKSPTNRSQLAAHSHSKTGEDVSRISSEMNQSSIVGVDTCHSSAACHVLTATSVYDATRDVYFYGSAAQLGKLCGALDMAKCGEVCWTDAFELRNQKICRGAASEALTSHTVSENGEVVLHVASWWKEGDNERDNEDPSTAMAVLSDAYVRRMTVIVSEGKAETKERKHKDANSNETRSGSSNKSNEATALTRTATLLHVAIINGDAKKALEVVRRIVSEEKGSVVSAHDSTIVAAFNLLSAGGHHQVRAADTVMRLRDTLTSTHFACSIQHGKVGALVVDGLVMCTGEAVSQGKALLQMAVALSTHNSTDAEPCVTDFTDSDLKNMNNSRLSGVSPISGLCLLCCHSELSSTYDCEAVDVATVGANTSKAKIIFRLAYRKTTKGNTDDEWMYRLKDEEDQSPFAVVNAVFARIASHDLEEASRLWREYCNNGSGLSIEISPQCKAALARHLMIR